MARYFFDTSALVKRYHVEEGAEVVEGLFAEPGSSFVISRLGVTETLSAFALKVRTGQLSSDDYAVCRQKFLGEIGRRFLNVARLTVGNHRLADQLIHRYAPAHPFRTLDALQLSVALELHQQGRIEAFVSADASLSAIARLEGLKVLKPLAIS